MDTFDCLDTHALIGFDWDDANQFKNAIKHGIDYKRIEEVFFNEPLLVIEDFYHSDNECRCAAFGYDDHQTKIIVIFTTRMKKIRVISAREMTKKEKTFYENNKNNPYL